MLTQFNWIELLRDRRPFYNLAELMRITGLSQASMRRALHRVTQRGLLVKLGKGVYANSFALPSLEQVAGLLYPPSYISLETGLFVHGIIEQAPQLVTGVSTNKTKRFQTPLGEIAYFRIKEALYFGYEIKDGFPMSLPEKAVLDTIYLQRKNGIVPTIDEWNLESLDLEKINSFMTAYPKTVQRFVNKHILALVQATAD